MVEPVEPVKVKHRLVTIKMDVRETMSDLMIERALHALIYDCYSVRQVTDGVSSRMLSEVCAAISTVAIEKE